MYITRALLLSVQTHIQHLPLSLARGCLAQPSALCYASTLSQQVTKLDNDSSSLTARPSAGNMTKAAAKPASRYQPREDDFYVDFIKQVLHMHASVMR